MYVFRYCVCLGTEIQLGFYIWSRYESRGIKTFLCFCMSDPEISFNSQYLKLGIVDNTIQIFFFFLAAQYCAACGILVPWPGINLCPLQWKGGVLTTGPPGKSPDFFLDYLSPCLTIFPFYKLASYVVLTFWWESYSHKRSKCIFPESFLFKSINWICSSNI